MIAFGYIGSLAYGVLCLLISLVAYKLGVPKKYTRKIVHILVGFEWLILYHMFGASVHFVVVCLIFTALLALSYKKSLMPMISSDGDNAPGTVYYGISMTVMAILSCFIEGFIFAFGIAVFCTSIGDGFAGVFGSLASKKNPIIYKSKTIIGTASAFVFSFASIALFSYVYKLEINIGYAVLIALFAAGLELITDFGLDNISLPLGVSALSYFLLYVDGAFYYSIPIVLTPFVAAFAIERGILTKKGVILALLLDALVTVSFGNFGFILLLAFLLLSVIVDKIKRHAKKSTDEISKRGDKRDEIQVFANGIIPLLMALLYLCTNEFVFVIGYNVALAEAFADTCASGLGAFAKNVFDPFRMKKVSAGLSGGMSVLGTFVSLAAPFLFLLISVAFGVFDFEIWAFSSVFAAFGALFDSFLGSVFQCKFKCKSCGIITEKDIHCCEKTERISGFKLITNDVVNILSAATAAALSIIIYIIFFI